MWPRKKKNGFLETTTLDPTPFLWADISFYEIFAHLSLIATVYYFTVYKLIGWDPAIIYLFNVNSRNTRERYGIRPKFKFNTIESCSGVFTVKFFYYWLWICKSLSRSPFLCKYYHPESTDSVILNGYIF